MSRNPSQAKMIELKVTPAPEVELKEPERQDSNLTERLQPVQRQATNELTTDRTNTTTRRKRTTVFPEPPKSKLSMSQNSKDSWIVKNVKPYEVPLKDSQCPTCTQKIFDATLRKEFDIVKKFEHLVLGR